MSDVSKDPTLEQQAEQLIAAPKVQREEMAVAEIIPMGSPVLDEALAYWIERRGISGKPPEWTSFNPAHHPNLLPNIMLFKKIDERYKCSLIGEAARTTLPLPLAGQYIDESMSEVHGKDVSMRLDHALATGLPNFVQKVMVWKNGYEQLGYSALHMPYSTAEGCPERVMSVMDFEIGPAVRERMSQGG